MDRVYEQGLLFRKKPTKGGDSKKSQNVLKYWVVGYVHIMDTEFLSSLDCILMFSLMKPIEYLDENVTAQQAVTMGHCQSFKQSLEKVKRNCSNSTISLLPLVCYG